jgi:stalled ribosome alternative rescue factor ArfA
MKPEPSAWLAAIVLVVVAAAVLAEEFVEEVLHVVRIGVRIGIAPIAPAPRSDGRLLRNRLSVDVHHRRAVRLHDLRERVRQRLRIGNDQLARIRGVDLLALAGSDIVRQHRAGKNADGKGSEQRKRGGKTMGAKAAEERFHKR